MGTPSRRPGIDYSCAWFCWPDETLELAQVNQVIHIAPKLLRRPGMHVLDIGCDNLAPRLTKQTGVGGSTRCSQEPDAGVQKTARPLGPGRKKVRVDLGHGRPNQPAQVLGQRRLTPMVCQSARQLAVKQITGITEFYGNKPRVFLAPRTFSTPIAMAAVRWATLSRSTRSITCMKDRSSTW